LAPSPLVFLFILPTSLCIPTYQRPRPHNAFFQS
jgi:hypothetical protein